MAVVRHPHLAQCARHQAEVVPVGATVAKIPNYRLVKTNRSYSVLEVADLFGVHRNTVRQWLKSGLVACDNRRPTIIHGLALADFLRDACRFGADRSETDEEGLE